MRRNSSGPSFASRRPLVTRNVVYVAVVQAIVLTALAYALPTWQDEEFTLATTAHGIGYAIHRALTYELQAPLYFAIVAALRTFGGAVFVSREFSVLAQVATTFVGAIVARRMWPSRDPWIFCALLASNPFTVYAALEIRTYSLSLLETAGLVAFFFEGFFCGDDRRAKFGFIGCAILGLYTQYFIAFEIAALFVALAIAGRFKALASYVVCTIVALVAFVPLGLIVRTQASDTLSVESSGPTGFGGMLLHPVNLVLARDYSAVGHGWESALWLVLRAAFVVLAIAGRPRFTRKDLAIAATFFVVDAIYVVLSDVLKLNLVVPRHFIALFLPEAMLAYAIVSSLTGPAAKGCALAIAIVFALSNSVTLVLTYASDAKFGDARRVGEYLTANAVAGDAIAAYPGDAVPPIDRYYKGSIPVEGFPVPQNQVVYQVDAALVRSPADARAAFARLPHARRLWFVMSGTCRANIHGCDTTQTVMAQRYTIARRIPFYQAVVFELEAKRP